MAKSSTRLAAITAFVIALISSLYVYNGVEPQWREQSLLYNVYQDDDGQLVYKYKGKEVEVGETVAYADSPLRQAALDANPGKPPLSQQWVLKPPAPGVDGEPQYVLLQPKYHLGWWSLLPAAISIALCLLTREPLTALLSGIVVGAFMLGRFDLSAEVFIPSLASTSAASLLLLYLWLLGGLMGIWAKTGAAQAFAEFMTEHFVRGPRSAKLVAWLLGVIFFQGGTVSTVLVGTTVRPLADKEKVSHEELSYIVDSTASPIALILAFNAWPAYIQALIFVPGVAVLATEADRLAFFFSSVPFSFYAILAVSGTFLLAMDITRFSGAGIRNAAKRARYTGELDAPGAQPLGSQAQHSTVPPGYQPHVLEFFGPLLLLIGIAVGTFIVTRLAQCQLGLWLCPVNVGRGGGHQGHAPQPVDRRHWRWPQECGRCFGDIDAGHYHRRDQQGSRWWAVFGRAVGGGDPLLAVAGLFAVANHGHCVFHWH